jgi:Uma2 family endonuclease
VVVPDLAAWRRERMGIFPDVPAIELAPDWVCEILSPGTRRFDLTEKRALYGAHGASHLWLLDPQAELLEAFVLQGGAWVLAGTPEGEVRLVPFEATGFPLSALWP